MTREHDSRYRVPDDPYPGHRCVNCPHLVYPNQEPGDPCLFIPDGCTCTDHRLPGQPVEGGAAA